MGIRKNTRPRVKRINKKTEELDEKKSQTTYYVQDKKKKNVMKREKIQDHELKTKQPLKNWMKRKKYKTTFWKKDRKKE